MKYQCARCGHVVEASAKPRACPKCRETSLTDLGSVDDQLKAEASERDTQPELPTGRDE